MYDHTYVDLYSTEILQNDYRNFIYLFNCIYIYYFICYTYFKH